jgi:outer membrane protein assembly factor BamB
MYGGGPDRNMVNRHDRDILRTLSADRGLVRWKAALGSKTHGQPVVAGGKVLVGTNNVVPRNPKRDTHVVNGEVEPVDKAVLMCFDAETGAFLWQLVFDKLPAGRVHDWPEYGISSVPTVEGDRVYFVTNRCTVVCASLTGPADRAKGIPRPGYEEPTDGVVFWEYDLIKEQNVFPHNSSVGCPLVLGDLLVVPTSNGVDEGHLNLPQPTAPSLVCLNKTTGKLVWKDNSPGTNILHGQWASPAYAAEPVPQVIYPAGDGWLYAFDPPTGRLLWKFDANPKDAVWELGGNGSRSDFIAAPVVNDGRVYIGVGQDPEHSTGIGRFWCVDLHRAVANAARSPGKDVSPELVDVVVKTPDGDTRTIGKPNPQSAAAWSFGGLNPDPLAVREYRFGRTMSTACVVDGLVYVPELAGYIHCLDARTGAHYWQYDTKVTVWGSVYSVDGKLLLGTDEGELLVFRHDPRPERMSELDIRARAQRDHRAQRLALRRKWEDRHLLARIEFDGPLKCTPVAAGGVLYVVSERTLYAIGPKPEE